MRLTQRYRYPEQHLRRTTLAIVSFCGELGFESMPASVGIRVYRMTIHRREGDRAQVSLEEDSLKIKGNVFLSRFAELYKAGVQNSEAERSFSFESKEDNGKGTSKGYVHYGTYGFAADLVDGNTRKKSYRRKTTDVEEIPLYYEFWCPDDADFALIAFQSFQGRSCIHLAMHQIQKDFETQNKGFYAKFKKLVPGDLKGSVYFGAPVKRLTLVRSNAPSDMTDGYYPSKSHTGLDFEITLKARRNGSIGPLGDVTKSLKKNGSGLVMHEGIGFDEVRAEVRIGKSLRRVGVFGSHSDAGVIDLTDAVERGGDGHPTFESMSSQCDEILRDFYSTLASQT